jgi:NAD(P) transhydrogenase
MEQGRLSSCHMFGARSEHITELFPYGIYTIPEISMVGQNEEQLTAAKVPYEVGIAKYAELAKSMMLGDETGMLKVLFDRNTLKLLGVHVIGQRATEIIHIGQAVLYYGGKVDYFRDTVFNYPTLAEAYKVAALDGLNKL